jgi:hypothetical protein
MGGGRQAWCPRCDEVRPARPGTACPVCGRQLLAVPSARPGQPQPTRPDQIARRLRALAPAAGAAGIAVLVLAVVASAFAAGRLTRTTPSTPAAAPVTTVPGFLDEGPETGRRDFNWEARGGRLTVELRSLTVGTGFSRLELHVDGVPRGREVSALQRLRIRDGAGNDLLTGGELAVIATAGSRPNPGGGIDTEVVLDRPIDLQAVATVELGGLTVARQVEERLRGTLVDRELRRRADGGFDDLGWLSQRSGCPGCQLRLACDDCVTVRVTGTAYRRGRILIALEALGRVEQTALNPGGRRVFVTDDAGVSELPAWIDGTGRTAVISIAAGLLAAVWPGDPGADEPMAFSVRVEAQAEEVVRGSWTIGQASG